MTVLLFLFAGRFLRFLWVFFVLSFLSRSEKRDSSSINGIRRFQIKHKFITTRHPSRQFISTTQKPNYVKSLYDKPYLVKHMKHSSKNRSAHKLSHVQSLPAIHWRTELTSQRTPTKTRPQILQNIPKFLNCSLTSQMRNSWRKINKSKHHNLTTNHLRQGKGMQKVVENCSDCAVWCVWDERNRIVMVDFLHWCDIEYVRLLKISQFSFR